MQNSNAARVPSGFALGSQISKTVKTQQKRGILLSSGREEAVFESLFLTQFSEG